jgi:hypothetical protein
MTRFMTLALASVALVTGASIAEADWSRSGSYTGPGGNTWSWRSNGDCWNGRCGVSRSVTGPNGNTVSQKAYGACWGGVCRGTVVTTGPNGGTVVRRGRVTRY